ncbi:MAG: LPS assembly lipoprotein LptE [candidate division WOR-3 bacterium]|nr:LPS assembly lipoprotein LptE [candidate division WOR-3 bacterium]
MFKFLAVMFLILSCCGYSTRTIVPSHLKTVAVPIVGNETMKPGLGDLLTDQLITDFNKERSLRVTSLDKANLILNCKITNYDRSPQSYTSSQEVLVWKITLSAYVEAEDKVEDTFLYQGDVSTFITYDAQSESEDIGIDRAIKKLSQEILRKVLTTW